MRAISTILCTERCCPVSLYLRYIYNISTLYPCYQMFHVIQCSAWLHGCRMLCDVTAAIICRVLQCPGPCPTCRGARCRPLSYLQVIIIGQIMAEKGQNLNTAVPCAACGHTAVAGWCRGVQVRAAQPCLQLACSAAGCAPAQAALCSTQVCSTQPAPVCSEEHCSALTALPSTASPGWARLG